MHKVYILEEVYSFAGDCVIGVYSTIEEAEKSYNKVTDNCYDYLKITEWNLETQENKELIRKSNA